MLRIWSYSYPLQQFRLPISEIAQSNLVFAKFIQIGSSQLGLEDKLARLSASDFRRLFSFGRSRFVGRRLVPFTSYHGALLSHLFYLLFVMFRLFGKIGVMGTENFLFLMFRWLYFLITDTGIPASTYMNSATKTTSLIHPDLIMITT